MAEIAAFSDSYAEARRKFVEAAQRAGAKLAQLAELDRLFPPPAGPQPLEML